MMKLFIGTYSEPILFGTGELFRGKGKGLYTCEFDGETVTPIHVLPLANPSYLAINEEKQKIYAVNELKEFQGQYGGGITEIDYDGQGRLKEVVSYGTDGTDPCHVEISPDKRFAGVANFADGVVTVFPMDEAGHLLPDKQLFRHAGGSAHPLRQKGPHAHSVIFSGTGKLFVPDLGIDQLKCYDCQGGIVIPDDSLSVAVAPGNGPRFGEFSQDGKHFYLINELGSSITHFTYERDQMIPRETVTTLPADFNGENICSDLHIAPSGKFLYASNRGHDSITVFAINADGALSEVERVACGGKTPRNFAIDPDGKFLLVGNQDSDTIVVFAIQEDGRLQYLKTSEFPTPVCIRFLRSC